MPLATGLPANPTRGVASFAREKLEDPIEDGGCAWTRTTPYQALLIRWCWRSSAEYSQGLNEVLGVELIA